jgi:formylglycine-generating enzyme required for sulfatase activity
MPSTCDCEESDINDMTHSISCQVAPQIACQMDTGDNQIGPGPAANSLSSTADAAPSVQSESARAGAEPPPYPPSRKGRCPRGMAFIPGGTFRKRDKEVVVQSFCLDIALVTVAAYARCARARDCTPAHDSGSDRADDSARCNRDRKDRARHPVNCIDYSQALAFCEVNGKRLPSDDELAWAASDGERGSKYPWGNREPLNQLCWNGDGTDVGKGNRQGTCPVGSYPKGDNPQGVKDLVGNVYEWTSGTFKCQESECGSLRGGSWKNLHAGTEAAAPVANHDDANGFRCAKTPYGQEAAAPTRAAREARQAEDEARRQRDRCVEGCSAFGRGISATDHPNIAAAVHEAVAKCLNVCQKHPECVDATEVHIKYTCSTP